MERGLNSIVMVTDKSRKKEQNTVSDEENIRVLHSQRKSRLRNGSVEANSETRLTLVTVSTSEQNSPCAVLEGETEPKKKDAWPAQTSGGKIEDSKVAPCTKHQEFLGSSEFVNMEKDMSSSLDETGSDGLPLATNKAQEIPPSFPPPDQFGQHPQTNEMEALEMGHNRRTAEQGHTFDTAMGHSAGNAAALSDAHFASGAEQYGDLSAFHCPPSEAGQDAIGPDPMHFSPSNYHELCDGDEGADCDALAGSMQVECPAGDNRTPGAAKDSCNGNTDFRTGSLLREETGICSNYDASKLPLAEEAACPGEEALMALNQSNSSSNARGAIQENDFRRFLVERHTPAAQLKLQRTTQELDDLILASASLLLREVCRCPSLIATGRNRSSSQYERKQRVSRLPNVRGLKAEQQTDIFQDTHHKTRSIQFMVEESARDQAIRLRALLQKVNVEYLRYKGRVHPLILAFGAVTGKGDAAEPYVSPSLSAISMAFRRLKDAISTRLKHMAE